MALKDFNPATYLDRLERIWWEADKYDTILGDIAVSVELMECDIHGQSGSSGVIEAAMEKPVLLAFGEHIIVGNVELSMEPLEASWKGNYADYVGSIDVRAVEPFLEMQSGLFMDCSFERWTYKSGWTLVGDVMDNCIFKQLEFNAFATSEYSYMELQGQRMSATMYDGTALALELERPTLNLSGSSEILCDMIVSFRRMKLDAIGGPPPSMRMTFEKAGCLFAGGTPIRGDIAMVARLGNCRLAGRTGYFGEMTVSAIPIFTQGWRGSFYAMSQLQATMRPFQISGVGFIGLLGDLEVSLGEIEFKASSGRDVIGSLNLEFQDLQVEMLTGWDYYSGGSGTCDLEPETLAFGVC